MGMYTELCLGVEFKQDTPGWVIDTLSFMARPGAKPGETPPPHESHKLFQTERWDWMLRSGGSYYFDAKPVLRWEKDRIGGWYLTVWTNIKNYAGEWEAFLDFIAPYLESEGFIGHHRYEEDENPTLLYAKDGAIVWRKVGLLAS